MAAALGPKKVLKLLARSLHIKQAALSKVLRAACTLTLTRTRTLTLTLTLTLTRCTACVPRRSVMVAASPSSVGT